MLLTLSMPIGSVVLVNMDVDANSRSALLSKYNTDVLRAYYWWTMMYTQPTMGKIRTSGGSVNIGVLMVPPYGVFNIYGSIGDCSSFYMTSDGTMISTSNNQPCGYMLPMILYQKDQSVYVPATLLQPNVNASLSVGSRCKVTPSFISAVMQPDVCIFMYDVYGNNVGKIYNQLYTDNYYPLYPPAFSAYGVSVSCSAMPSVYAKVTLYTAGQTNIALNAYTASISI